MDNFSNAAGSRVKIFKIINGSSINVIISAAPIPVDLPVFKCSIKTDGTRAVISMKIVSKEGFGFYYVVVSNEIDSSFWLVEIIPISKDTIFLLEL